MVRVRYFVFCLLFAVLPTAHSFAVESCPALVVPQFLPGTNMFNLQAGISISAGMP